MIGPHGSALVMSRLERMATSLGLRGMTCWYELSTAIEIEHFLE